MTALFSSLGFMSVFYVMLLPLVLVQLFAIILFPNLLVPGSKPLGAAKAVYCYMMQAVGIILMTIGALPAIYGVLERIAMPVDRYTTEVYIALLVIFATGGLTFLWHEQMAQTIDLASRKVTAALFWFLWRAVGAVIVITSILSLLLTMLLGPQPLVEGWWIMPILLLVYGWLLCAATRLPVAGMGTSAPAKVVHKVAKKK